MPRRSALKAVVDADTNAQRPTPLDTAGLTVTERREPTYVIAGNTRAHSQLMRDLGGAWCPNGQHWIFVGTDPRPAIEASLDPSTAPGLSDSATSPELTPSSRVVLGQQHRGHRQRLRDRFMTGDESGLPDYELLELLLFFCIRYVDTKPLAKALLAELGSLGSVLSISAERLNDFDPFWEMKKKRPEDIAVEKKQLLVLFRSVRVLAARLGREDTAEGTVLTKWDRLIDYLRTTMAHRATEQFRVLFLNRQNVLIADEVQNEGSIDHTPVYPREVVKRALTLEASAIIMVHNHPSNHPQPSRGDIDMTRTVQQALSNVGVVLHDHIIVSRKGHTSFKQMGLL